MSLDLEGQTADRSLQSTQANGEWSKSAVSSSSQLDRTLASSPSSLRSSTTSAYVCSPCIAYKRETCPDIYLRPLQVLVDGPASKPEAIVPRHSAPLANLSLTHIVIPKLPRAAGTAAIRKMWEKHEVEKTWDGSAWAKNRERSVRRKNLSDFERFKVMRLRKQVGLPVQSHIILDHTRRWGWSRSSTKVQHRIHHRHQHWLSIADTSI